MRAVVVCGLLIFAVALVSAAPGSAAARSDRPVASAGHLREAGHVSPPRPTGLLPFTKLDALLMASGCCVLFLFGAGLRVVPRQPRIRNRG